MSRADLVFERGVVGRRLASSLRFEELTIALTGKSTSITTVAWDYTLVEHGRRSVQVIFATWHWTNKLRSSKKNHFFDSTGPSVTIPESRSRRAIRQSQTVRCSKYTTDCLLRCGGKNPEGGGLYRESQWRQQTRRCTRICPQRYESDRPALELEVRGEVDRARRSSGGRVPPAPPP